MLIAEFGNKRCKKGREYDDLFQEDFYSLKRQTDNILHSTESAVNRIFPLVEQVFPEPPDFLLIGILGKILYKHFLLVPGPYDLERYLKVRNTLQSAMARRLSHIPGIVKL
jgi:hypothetical protein